jgi:hypothetical protein
MFRRVALFKFVCVPCTWVGQPMGAELFMIGSQSQLHPQTVGCIHKRWAASMWPRQVRFAPVLRGFMFTAIRRGTSFNTFITFYFLYTSSC